MNEQEIKDALGAISSVTFDWLYWKDKINQAKMQRLLSGWDQQAINGWRIFENDLPLGGKKLTDAPDWKGEFFVDNWIAIAIRYKVCMLTGSEISIDLKSEDGSYTKAQELLERETNTHFSQYNFLDVEEQVLYSKYYTGMGWKRNIWNVRKRSKLRLEGVPMCEYVDSMKIWIDPATKEPDKSDRGWLYHEELYRLNDIKRAYPKWADRIQATLDPSKPWAQEMIKIGTLQFKEKQISQGVFIEDMDSGAVATISKKQWQEFQSKGYSLPEGLRHVKTEKNPEGIFEIEEDIVYSAIVAPDQDLVLEQPVEIGDIDDYQCDSAYVRKNNPYSFGHAFYMAPLQEMDIVSMTVAMIQVMKWYRQEKMIQEDSLVNEEKYIKNGHKLGVDPIVKKGWQKNHPGEKAVEHIPLPEYPIGNDHLHDRIVQRQKDFSGTPDVSTGNMPFAGMPGVAVAQLQAAARTYHREDLKGFRKLVEQDVNWLIRKICQYRNYPHAIQGSDEETGRDISVPVATELENTLSFDSVYPEITIRENHELAKELERQYVEGLWQKDMISRLDYLTRTGDVTPQKTIDASDAEKPYMIMAKIIQSKPPEIQKMIQDFIMQVDGNPASQGGQQTA